MKDVLYFIVWLLMGALVTFLFIGAMGLFLAMPNMLKWLSGYIGEPFAWVLFLTIIGTIIAIAIEKGRN